MSASQRADEAGAWPRLSVLAAQCRNGAPRTIDMETWRAWGHALTMLVRALHGFHGATVVPPPLVLALTAVCGWSCADARIGPVRDELRELRNQLHRLVKSDRVVLSTSPMVGRQFGPNMMGLRQFLAQASSGGTEPGQSG